MAKLQTGPRKLRLRGRLSLLTIGDAGRVVTLELKPADEAGAPLQRGSLQLSIAHSDLAGLFDVQGDYFDVVVTPAKV